MHIIRGLKQKVRANILLEEIGRPTLANIARSLYTPYSRFSDTANY